MRRHPSYRLTDEQLDRFDDTDIDAPCPAHLLPPEGIDALAVFAAQVEAVRATFHDHEREAS